MINVAMIGFGLSGRYLQAPYLVLNPNFKLKTVVTNSSKTPQELYDFVEVCHNFEEVLADASIDLVCVNTPSASHFEYAQKALLAGKHVLVEKPMAATAEQVQILIDLAKKQQKVLSVYQNRRFDSDFRTLQKIVQGGLLGELLSFEASYHRFKPTLNPKKWKEVPAPANGILFDLGAHLIDQVISLFGTPEKFSGEVFTQRENSLVDDAFDLSLDYGKLKVRLKSSLLVREDVPRYILHGTKGSFIKYGIDVQEDSLKAGILPNDPTFGIEQENIAGTLNTELNGLHFRGKITSEVGNYGLLFENLYDAITGTKPLIVKPEEVLEQIKIIEKITLSCEK